MASLRLQAHLASSQEVAVISENVFGAFGEEHAAELAGVSRRVLRTWDKTGLLRPSYGAATGLPYGRVYSFRDLVSLRVLAQLRFVHKVPMAHLQDVFRDLSKKSDAPWASTTLEVLNRRVVIRDPGAPHKREAGGRQRVLNIPLRVVIRSVRDAVATLNRRGDDEVGKVIQTRFIAENQPVLAGTRIPIAAIKSFADAGYDAKAIQREYPELTAADIKAAVAYSGVAAAA